MPKDIISLEGLMVDTVERGEKNDKEYGVVFRHRDGVYQAKEYYFKDKEVYDEWVKHLSDFRTSTVEDLYTFFEKIGGGNYADVFKGKNKETG
jgi:hypothetical protein